METQQHRGRVVVGLLVLACVTIITLDARQSTTASPVDPLRTAVGAVIGPAENATTDALGPLTRIPQRFADVSTLQRENAALRGSNAQLTTRLRVAGVTANRAEEVAGITGLADTSGYRTVDAQVIGIGPAQSFSRTVTIDAGTARGVAPDQTVINADGLVGRVIQVGPTTATVLLIIDRESTVGGRLGSSMELGFLTGDGQFTGGGTLELSLVDHTVSPHVDDTVVTWGSRNDAPYVSGVPIGKVVSVHSSPAELTQTAQIQPFVDFSSLDVVAVVTNAPHPASGASVAGGSTQR